MSEYLKKLRYKTATDIIIEMEAELTAMSDTKEPLTARELKLCLNSVFERMNHLYAMAGHAAEKGSQHPSGRPNTIEDFRQLQDGAIEHGALVEKLKLKLPERVASAEQGEGK